MKNSGKMVLVFDCGATNIRVIAIDINGKIVAGKSYPNKVSKDPYFNGGLIWDVEEIWEKLCDASLQVTSQINKEDIAGVTFTTFGVDGALFDRNGEMLYPVISWQCNRTNAIMAAIEPLYPDGGALQYERNLSI